APADQVERVEPCPGDGLDEDLDVLVPDVRRNADRRARFHFRVPPDDLLDLPRRDVLAAAAQPVAAAPGKVEEAIGIARAEITRVEPSVAQRLGGALVVLQVPIHEEPWLALADEDLARLVELHLEVRNRPPDRADAAFEVDRGKARGLRHAVRLADADAEAPLERFPEMCGRSAAPRGAYGVIAVVPARRLLEEQAEHAAEEVYL